MREDKDFILRLYKKERLKEGREDWIQSCIEKLIEEDYFIDSSKLAAEFITAQSTEKVLPHETLKVMKHNMGMKYKKVTKASVHLNSTTNLILRQQWALQYIDLFKLKKNFINVDETWLGMSDFRQMKWFGN